MADPRFSDPGMQQYVRDLARARPGAASEREGAHMLWYPVLNTGNVSERIPCKGAPFTTQTAAKAAARDFKERCRAELGESE